MQAIALLTGIAAGAGWYLHAQSEPVDAARLKITVAQLRSYSVEGRMLLERRAAGSATDLFVRQHTQHLQKKTEAARAALADAETEADVASAARAASELAAALNDALARAADQRTSPTPVIARFAQLQATLATLERAIKARAQ